MIQSLRAESSIIRELRAKTCVIISGRWKGGKTKSALGILTFGKPPVSLTMLPMGEDESNKPIRMRPVGQYNIFDEGDGKAREEIIHRVEVGNFPLGDHVEIMREYSTCEIPLLNISRADFEDGIVRVETADIEFWLNGKLKWKDSVAVHKRIELVEGKGAVIRLPLGSNWSQ